MCCLTPPGHAGPLPGAPARGGSRGAGSDGPWLGGQAHFHQISADRTVAPWDPAASAVILSSTARATRGAGSMCGGAAGPSS